MSHRRRHSKSLFHRFLRPLRRLLGRVERDTIRAERRGRRSNRRLLKATAAALALCVPLGWLGHRLQLERLAGRFRDSGAAALEAEDWRRADRNLRQYLELRPNDAAALRQVALANEHLIVEPADLSRATRLYSLAISAAPADADLRLRLGRLQLASAPDQALDSAEKLLVERPGDVSALQLRAQAMDCIWTKNESSPVSADALLEAYDDWTQSAPDDLAAPLRLATLLTTFTQRLAQETGRSASDLRQQALRVGERLVSQFTDCPEAHLGRYSIRRLLATQGGDRSAHDQLPADLARALELAPQHAEANLAAAEEICPLAWRREVGQPWASAVSSETLSRAQRHLQIVQRAAPHDERAYLGLAALGCLGGDRTGARRVLRLAAQQVVAPSSAVYLRLAEEALAADDWDDAAVELRLAEQTVHRRAAWDEAETSLRRHDSLALCELLWSQLHLAAGRAERDPARAVASLEQAAARPLSPTLAYRVLVELATAYEAAGDRPQADAIRRRLQREAAETADSAR